MTAIYNEIEPFAVDWLRSLAENGHVAAGAVIDRSVEDLTAEDVGTATQAHFFAGIGGWSYALRLVGWPDDVPVWTGSCPCQPFSVTGKKKGFKDERHLWPAWFKLISECRPPVVFGEQVASPDGLQWLDAVSADLEGAGYAFAAADLCAAGVGAPHLRNRLYFVGVADADRVLGGQGREIGGRRDQGSDALSGTGSGGGSRAGAVATPHGSGLERRSLHAERSGERPAGAGGLVGGLGNADGDGTGRFSSSSIGPETEGTRQGIPYRLDGIGSGSPSSVGVWSDVEWIQCRDGFRRPTQPGIHPLAHGVPGRVGRLRGYGNAVVPQVAATFIRAVMETLK